MLLDVLHDLVFGLGPVTTILRLGQIVVHVRPRSFVAGRDIDGFSEQGTKANRYCTTIDHE